MPGYFTFINTPELSQSNIDYYQLPFNSSNKANPTRQGQCNANCEKYTGCTWWTSFNAGMGVSYCLLLTAPTAKTFVKANDVKYKFHVLCLKWIHHGPYWGKASLLINIDL